MTDRSVSWTDAASVAQLLARASAPRRTPAHSFGTSSGAALARPLPVPRAVVAAPPVVAPVPAPRSIPAPPQPRLKSQAPVPRLVQTSENPSDRLDALLAWALDHQRCTGAFIAAAPACWLRTF